MTFLNFELYELCWPVHNIRHSTKCTCKIISNSQNNPKQEFRHLLRKYHVSEVSPIKGGNRSKISFISYTHYHLGYERLKYKITPTEQSGLYTLVSILFVPGLPIWKKSWSILEFLLSRNKRFQVESIMPGYCHLIP